MKKREVAVHVEELVVDRSTNDEHQSFEDAFCAELTRLIAAYGVPPALSRTVDISDATVTAGETPAFQLARALYRGIK
jgi:hypothetical protein